MATLEQNARNNARYAAEKLAWMAAHPGVMVCQKYNCYGLATGTQNTHPACEKHRNDEMSDKVLQDLSAYPKVCFGTRPGGLRWFSCFLPWPSWTKHTRTALTAKPGFRPLVKAAKQYQSFIAQAVIVNEIPALPWLRKGSEFELDFISFSHKSDADQHTGGLQDDFVKSGLLADDKACACTHSRRIHIPTSEEKRIYLAGWEVERVAHDG